MAVPYGSSVVVLYGSSIWQFHMAIQFVNPVNMTQLLLEVGAGLVNCSEPGAVKTNIVMPGVIGTR